MMKMKRKSESVVEGENIPDKEGLVYGEKKH
jgi:hypothetical protein